MISTCRAYRPPGDNCQFCKWLRLHGDGRFGVRQLPFVGSLPAGGRDSAPAPRSAVSLGSSFTRTGSSRHPESSAHVLPSAGPATLHHGVRLFATLTGDGPDGRVRRDGKPVAPAAPSRAALKSDAAARGFAFSGHRESGFLTPAADAAPWRWRHYRASARRGSWKTSGSRAWSLLRPDRSGASAENSLMDPKSGT